MSDPVDPKLPDLRYIRELAKVFKQYELDELEIEAGNQRMLLRRAEPTAAVVGMPAPVATLVAPSPAPAVVAAAAHAVVAPAASAEGGGDFITSPFVGTFYRSPRPDAPSFVDVGQRVQPGETVCIIEAMKLFNEIEADFACQIEECLIEGGQPVEYGAKLFRVRKL